MDHEEAMELLEVLDFLENKEKQDQVVTQEKLDLKDQPAHEELMEKQENLEEVDDLVQMALKETMAVVEPKVIPVPTVKMGHAENLETQD